MVLKIFISFNHAFHPRPVHILKCASKYILVDPYPGLITWQFSPAIGENPLPLYEGATRLLNPLLDHNKVDISDQGNEVTG